MKSSISRRPLLSKNFLVTVTALAALALGASAYGQAEVTFSGGNNSPLELTLDAPVTYTITAAGAAGSSPVFVLQGVGNPFGAAGADGLTGNITFTINGGAPLAFNVLGAGTTAGAIAADDLYAFGMNSLPGVSVGDVVVLGTGTLSTVDNFTIPLPASGSYSTIITDTTGNPLSADGVPEPSTWAMLLGGVGLLGGAQRLRRRRP